jgi:replicative DNA helicase
MKRKHNVGVIFIDYLQLMSGDDERRGNREQEISKISRGLKALGKELHVPIIALSQLSREPEKRKGELRMPQLSDLRESGAIEQDADEVIFMYRPEYYDTNSNELGESTRGETHLKIAKHRSGKLDSLKLRANLAIQKFFTWDGEQQQLPLAPGNWKPVTLPGVSQDDLDFDN